MADADRVLGVIQKLKRRLRTDVSFVVSDEEFEAVQAAVRLMSDVPDAPVMPVTKDHAEEAVRAVDALMWRQLEAVRTTRNDIFKEWISLGGEEAEQRARARVAGLDGQWARDTGQRGVDREVAAIREDELAGRHLSDLLTVSEILDATSGIRKAKDYKASFEFVMAALAGKVRQRDTLFALHFAGELALGAGMFEEAVEVLGRAIREGEHLGTDYYRDSSLGMRAYAFIELGEGCSAVADIVQLPDDFEMFWIDNVPGLTKRYLLKRASALESSNCT